MTKTTQMKSRFHDWNQYRDRHFRFDKYHVIGYGSVAIMAIIDIADIADIAKEIVR